MATILSAIEMPGWIFQRIRERLDYSQSQFANHCKKLRKSEGVFIGTRRDAIAMLERKEKVPPRYLRALVDLAGLAEFENAYATVTAEIELEQRQLKERRERIAKENEEC